MTKTSYNPQEAEEKWQAFWEEQQLFQQTETQEVLKPEDAMFLLFAFAYPSGSGLHVGHVESKTALDILARYYRMSGKKVFFPVGWDAFGLPAENYAIKTGIPPAETTKQAINTFRRQIKRIGVSYDWANVLATSHPEYYKWTQWIFLQLYRKGLAYQSLGSVNWCPTDQTVLANEQVVNGVCERCGAEVVQKNLKQWYFKISEYKDELISGLDTVDWPKPTKQQQLNWIGRSEGIEITYKIIDSIETVTCFTTTPVNFGATFIVLAPEHKIVNNITTSEQKEAVDLYIQQAAKNSELERTINKEKTGVFTGAYAINQVTNEKMPIYVADFALAHVGTGAVQGCPAHDERDFEFAMKFNLPIKRVVVGDDGDTSPVTRKEQLVVKGMNGTMINADFLNGMKFKDAMKATMDYFEEKGWGKRIVNYKLRDWLISRQRYWGAPIPIVYDPEGNAHPVKEEHLPWLLPTDVEFKPTGESPLVHSQEFKERTERLYGKGWRPEYDTMDTFVDSSWYYLRYTDSRNPDEFASKEQMKKWLPVDLYMIGPEHIVLHLLYARFFTKFLRDEGYLNFDEPFQKMRHQGMILGPDGRKMSKSKGNVINPDEIIEKFGADTLRMYEMFMGPLDADKPWDARAVSGMYRFLNRIYELVSTQQENKARETDLELQRALHRTIKKVTQDLPELKFNTSIAMLMELLNTWEAGIKAGKSISMIDLMNLVKIVAPFAPFLAEDLYQKVGNLEQINSIHLTSWPTYDETLVQQQEITLPIQVNGKLRAQLTVPSETVADQQAILDQAEQVEALQKWITGAEVIKKIYVPGKVINFVVRS